MSEPYTPTTETVRASAEGDDWGCGLLPGEFDRWLAEVKAEAWEEGFNAQLWSEQSRNPYRQGESK